ncbi:MarR family winged helix-turn-helix transcriptional regulator [Pseudarthrobacter sp. P1]|uniref:MarR family winged helix-turn-helix transcriptional regulator n=1 Tax=Pseudarthrobacter sp. P1 TaxID=3418418 RepID=UPI003CF1649E
MGTHPRDDDLQAVYEHLLTVTRRGSARSRRLSEPLSFVEHSLVRFVASRPGVRATDIAAAFALNRSTVSRQVNTLIELGLVAYATSGAEEPGRGRVLGLTEHGRAQLANSAAAQRAVLTERLNGWSDADVAAFAAMLARFNEGADEPTHGQGGFQASG